MGESEIGNANKVKVYGKGLTEGMANELNEFSVNTKEAGKHKTIQEILFIVFCQESMTNTVFDCIRLWWPVTLY